MTITVPETDFGALRHATRKVIKHVAVDEQFYGSRVSSRSTSALGLLVTHYTVDGSVERHWLGGSNEAEQ